MTALHVKKKNHKQRSSKDNLRSDCTYTFPNTNLGNIEVKGRKLWFYKGNEIYYTEPILSKKVNQYISANAVYTITETIL